jgi:aspartyl-tRNA(Asn)/glutamyl-tRNA(Gln) amidotransferase subunit C
MSDVTPGAGPMSVSARIGRDDVAHIADLARLELSAEEIEHFTEHLGKVLDHAADIDALDLADVPPTSHPLPLANVMRDDEAGPTLDPADVLAAAPDADDGRFRVPPILGEAP